MKSYCKKGRIIKAAPHSEGYKTASLYNKGEYKTVYIHRLVAEAFIRKPTKLQEVNHINANRSDNRVENLEWVTAKQNTQHAIKIGNNKNRGETANSARLKETEALAIIALINLGVPRMEIVKKFNTTYDTVRAIHRGTSWIYLPR
jgi:hypothetical protein